MNQHLAKEARQMLWPWAAVTSAAAAALLMPWGWQPAWMPVNLAEATLALVAFLGFPLLAGLPIGYEFQYQTISGLLSAPVDRGRIWREKFIVTLAVVIAPAILCAIRGRENHVDLGAATLVGAWITALASSAMFWTLIARSTMGGLALNICVQWLLFTGWAYADSEISAHGHASNAMSAAGAVLLLLYAGAMVWLGRRGLMRLEAIEGASAGDPLSAISARLVPRQAAEWFQCRPKGAVLNLIKKELRLLRPVWLLAALNVLAWTCLAALGTDADYKLGLRNPKNVLILAAMVGTIALSPLIAILAGALSLGEEKNYGTHAWHMTLPVSARLQWTVKLGVALLAGTLFAGALPPIVLAAHGLIVGAPVRSGAPNVPWAWPVVFAGVTLAGFWLSALVKGTVRAALWVFPALFLFGVTYSLAFDSGYKFAAWAQTLTDRILLWLDPFKLMYVPYPNLPYWGWWQPWSTTFVFVGLPVIVGLAPVAAYILAQSYRKFRGQAEDTNRRLAQSLLMAAAIIFVCGIVMGDFGGLIQRSWMQWFHFGRETNAAILKLEAGKVFQAGTPPVRLTAEELERAVPMSESTRYWLGNGTVTVGPAPPDWETTEKLLGRNRFGYFPEWLKAEQPFLAFVASVRIRDGLTCRMFYRYKSHTLPKSADLALAVSKCR